MLSRCLLLLSLPVAAPERDLIKGVSYGPVPLRTVGGAQLPADDWFCDEAVRLWGKSGRGDLKVISQLGANMVRLYGNNPAIDHTGFLDEALLENLSVAPGMSDFPYYQNRGDNCLADSDFDCFKQVKALYAQNLQKGFLTLDGQYHPSLKYMNILNEPDLKMPNTATTGNLTGVKQMCRSLISAFDAMLDAEKDAGVTGPLINYTATFSYAICQSCEWHNDKPALGQIAQLHDAMHHPAKYGYRPRNNITAAYEARFTHSFNTQNPATDLEFQFLDDYGASFPNTPVYIGEYHRVGANQTEDLSTILGLARSHPLFLGISFFQFQVAYWKGGSEKNFGMFGLGDYSRGNMTYFSKTYPIYCSVPVDSIESGMSLPDALAQVYGGRVDEASLCEASPWGVPLDFAGFEEISTQRAPQMKHFVRRWIHHLGATVDDDLQLGDFANRFIGGGEAAFGRMAAELGSQPDWLEFDSDARCVADRDAEPGTVGAAIGWACSNLPGLNCSLLPEECTADPYRTGDYVFSRFYAGQADASDPLSMCSFGGAAIFASSKLFSDWTGASLCSLPPTTTSSTSVTVTSTSTVSTQTVTSSTSTVTTHAHDVFPSTTNASGPFLSQLEDGSSAVCVRWLILCLLAGCALRDA